MRGRRPQELVGKKIPEIIGEQAFQTILPHVNAVLAGQRVEYETELHYRIAQTWRTLARGYEFEGSLGRFISFNESRKKALPVITPAYRETISSAGPAAAVRAAELTSRKLHFRSALR